MASFGKKASAFFRGLYAAKSKGPKQRATLKRQQLKKFESLKRRVLINSPFYKPYLNADFEQFPIIDKKQHMANFNAINTAQLDRDKCLNIAIAAEQNRDFTALERGYSVGLSSGTSGNRGLFVASPVERAEWAGYIIGKVLPLTLKKQRIAFFLRANNKLYETVNSPMINFNYFDLIQPLSAHLSALNTFSPTMIIAPAQVLKALAKQKSELALPDLTKIISVAEVLDSYDKHYIENCFKLKVDEIYQCTEGFLAYTCSRGHLHLNESTLIIEREWVDKESGRFVPIITDLRRRTQPIIRYRLDDILVENTSPCGCGSNLTRLERIEGRCDDVLVMRSNSGELKNIYPDFIRNTIIASHSDIEDYKVVQDCIDELSIYIKPFEQTILQAIQTELDNLWTMLDVIPPKSKNMAYSDASFIFKKRRVVRNYNV